MSATARCCEPAVRGFPAGAVAQRLPPLPAFSNVRRIPTLFIGYRHLNRQQIEMICGGLRVGPSAPLALPPSVFHGFILFSTSLRVPENLAILPLFVASAGFDRRCWRNTHPQKKEGSKSPLLINTKIRLFFDIGKSRSTNSTILWIVRGCYIALYLGFMALCRCV